MFIVNVMKLWENILQIQTVVHVFFLIRLPKYDFGMTVHVRIACFTSVLNLKHLCLRVRNDLLMVCRQLNMEDSVAEIMGQLGSDERGKISFEDFTRCRMQLVNEIRKEEGQLSLVSSDSEKRTLHEHVSSWPTSSENSLGMFSTMILLSRSQLNLKWVF